MDLYVFSELMKNAFFGSFIAVIVLLCLQVLRLSDVIVKAGLDKVLVFRMLFSLALSFVPLVVPIACLFAMLNVFGRMSTDRELVAAQSLGVSPARLLRPGLVFGVIACVSAIYFSFIAGPAGNRGFEAALDEAFKKKVASALNSGTFNEGFLDMVLFVDKVNPVTQDLERVFLNDSTNFKAEASISARRGRWIPPTENGSLGILKLTDGVVISREIEKNIVRRVKFDDYRIYADFSSQAGRPKDSPPSLSWEALTTKRRNKAPNVDLRPVWIEMARRFAVSFTCLIFVPLSFALSIDNRRTAKSRAVMAGLLLLFGYWTVYFALMTWIYESSSRFILTHEWFSWFVIWSPNLALTLGGGWLFHKKKSGMTN